MPYSALRNKKNDLIRKARDGSVFVANFTAPAIVSLTSGGTAEVQTVTITGTPTSGTFTLTFGTQTTAAIQYNAAAGAVQTALQALTNIGTGNVTVTGGPGPATPWTVTFAASMGDVAQMTATGSLIGGTTPAVAVTTTTPGVPVDLSPLPTGYEDVGWTTVDGATYSRTTNASDIQSFGSLEPVRSDITSDSITMQVTCQETKLLTIGLLTGADVSNLKATAGTGETSISKPSRLSLRYYRVLGLFLDTDDSGNEIYMARYMPRARITAVGDVQYHNADAAVQAQVTFTGYEDSTVGYSHRWLWSGPGWLNLLSRMNIPLGP